MNKLMHVVVFAGFGLACWFIWAMLEMTARLFVGLSQQLPAFSRFCLIVEPALLVGVTVLAAVYCLVVWIRKWEKCPSWVAFLATTTSTVVLLILPTMITIYLPIIDALHRIPRH